MTTARVAGERGPIVFMVQEPVVRDKDTGERKALNTLPALRFGTIEVLLGRGKQVMFNAAAAVDQLRAKLAGYTDRDFILAAGDPVAIGIACALAAQVNGGRFTVLKWDNQEHTYYPVPVNLNGGS